MRVYGFNDWSALDERAWAVLRRHVSANRRARIDRMIQLWDVRRSLVSESLIRMLACQALAIDNASIEFAANPFGRPYLSGFQKVFDFNLSHSGEWVLCAVGQPAIGVDIERIQPIDLELARRYFSAAEYRRWLGDPASQRLARFYELWTLKESYLKAVGKGLAIPLDSFTITPIGDGGYAVAGDPAYALKTCPVHPGYAGAVCRRGGAPPSGLCPVTGAEIMGFFDSQPIPP